MIDGLDFYQYTLSMLANHNNIEIKQENILSIENNENGGSG